MKTTRALIPVFIAITIAACSDDPSDVTVDPAREVGVIVSSSDRLLTIFSVDTPQSRTQVGLGPDGSPVTVAARKNYAVVPLGTLNAVTIVNLQQRQVSATVPLPPNSGATGAAFINDSLALVANPGRNSVTVINARRGTAGAEIPVGTYPQFIIASGDTAFVLNAELGPDFQPRRTGTITVLAGATPRVVGTIELTGRNPGAAAIGPDGLLYVLNSGTFGSPSGSLSAVDRRTLAEVRHDTGFGEFPGAIAITANGQVHVGAFGYGVAVWNPTTRTFVRAPANAVQPGGIAGTSGLGVDSRGRLYALKPDCRAPSTAYRLSGTLQVEAEIQTGICPLGITFTHTEAR